ncbi:hypothetical protein [Nocardia australiensis]|uniref:hypothetical protein n=1 Tax=Nocardia australiensis TaxID=2887191 RepID=UPI001D14CFC5|nr:hypothetical protein [Nocardia australiensis]
MSSDVTALNTAVDEGQLWIDGLLVAEGAPERCARHYEQLADRVEAQIQVLSAAASLPGFGGFGSGESLRRGFENKAGSAMTELQSYAASARELAQTFRAAAAAYAQADIDSAAAVGRIETAGVTHA